MRLLAVVVFSLALPSPSKGQIFPVAAAGAAVAVGAGLSCIHQVQEGYVGLYYRGGRLTDRVTEPGWHRKSMFDRLVQVQTTVQSDSVRDIPCGTSGGVVVNFGKIEVVNRLRKEHVLDTVRNYTEHYDRLWIYDKVHHEMNQLCSAHSLQEIYIDLFATIDETLQASLQAACDVWAPGIEIIAVRVTKPELPKTIEENYRLTEAEKSRLLIATEAQKVAEKQAETEQKKARIQAQQAAEVSAIRVKQELLEKKAAQEKASIDDEMALHRAKSKADSEAYASAKEAEVNKKLLTPEYLAMRSIEELSKSTRTYFGSSIPSTFVDPAGLVAAFAGSGSVGPVGA